MSDNRCRCVPERAAGRFFRSSEWFRCPHRSPAPVNRYASPLPWKLQKSGADFIRSPDASIAARSPGFHGDEIHASVNPLTSGTGHACLPSKDETKKRKKKKKKKKKKRRREGRRAGAPAARLRFS